MLKKRNQKGFTLAELLIVVAIIAVLVAIAIPVFTRQLERSRESTDISNVRSAYAQLVTQHIEDGLAHSMTVEARQTQADWQGVSGTLTVQKDGTESSYNFSAKTKNSSYTVTVDADGDISVN